jgi:hypothetical protein
MTKVDRFFAVVDLILIGVVSYLAVTTSDGWWWYIVGILIGSFLLGFVIRNRHAIFGRRSS